jgi:hypothetical protein
MEDTIKVANVIIVSISAKLALIHQPVLNVWTLMEYSIIIVKALAILRVIPIILINVKIVH